MSRNDNLLPNCVKHAKAMGEIEKRLEEKIGGKKMKLIDGADFFIQVCRTHDEFIGLDELAELLDKTPTVKAIPVEWIKETIKLAESVQSSKYAEHLRILLEDWREEND